MAKKEASDRETIARIEMIEARMAIWEAEVETKEIAYEKRLKSFREVCTSRHLTETRDRAVLERATETIERLLGERPHESHSCAELIMRFFISL